MKTLQYNISMEPLRCRVPGFFAYIEDDVFGVSQLHYACESVDGSFGRIIQNIKLPTGVNLITWVRTDTLECDDSDTQHLFLSDSIDYNTIPPEHCIEKVISYSYIKTTEDSAIRYEEKDGIPFNINDGSEDYIKVPKRNGSDLVMDCDGTTVVYEFYKKVAQYEYYRLQKILIQENTYTYRTLIDFYYQYKPLLNSNNSFIQFIERGIGRIKIDKTSIGLDNEQRYPLVPDYVYLVEVEDMISQLESMRSMCNMYNANRNTNSEINSTQMCCDCEKFNKMGGVTLIDYLRTLLPERENRCNEYYGYADMEHPLTIDLSIHLPQTMKDCGYMSSDLPYYEPGKKYLPGDLCIYNDTVYRCLDETCGIFNPNTLRIEFDTNEDVWKELGSGVYSINNLNGNRYFPLPTDSNEPDAYNVYGGSKSLLKDLRINKPYLNEFDNVEVPDQTEDWLYYYKVGNISSPQEIETDLLGNIVRDFNVNLNLGRNKSIRVFAENDLPQQLSNNDAYVDSYGYLHVWNGNTNTFSPPQQQHNNIHYKVNTIGGNKITDLHSFGNVLTSITRNSTDRIITFKYKVGAHLIADLFEIQVDDDSNYQFFYNNWRLDTDSPVGIEYEESYRYVEGGEIDTILTGTDFDNYVSKNRETITNNGHYMVNNEWLYKKFAFITPLTNRTIYVNGVESDYSYIESEFHVNMPSEFDAIYTNLYKDEYYNSLLFDPVVKTDVKISRGNATSYERHHSLSSIKTMEDMESFRNGGFFTFTE